MAKMKDRWVPTAPHTLDGMAYMPYATYSEDYPKVNGTTPVDQTGIDMDLSQDYRAIRWMQDNIQGSPVIVEANSRNLYRWYSRFTIYTGLPGVVGWEWHEQQQRAIEPSRLGDQTGHGYRPVLHHGGYRCHQTILELV